jgi:peptidoglycan-N-acetylglucosamine deacetylase
MTPTVSAPKKLTLTFDNGPDPTCTPYVLDVLKERNIRSTFFVCAQGNALHAAMPAAMPEGRALLTRIRDEGHWVGNHTLTHTVELGTTIDDHVLAREIGLNQSLLREYNDQRLFRPYMAGGLLGPGTFSPPALQYLCDNDFTLVLFNSCPRDWEWPETWPDFAMTDIERDDWTVMIVHDVAAFRGMQQLERFLDNALDNGVTFVQDFAPACVPILRGKLTGSLDGLVCGSEPEAPQSLSLAAVPYIHDLPSIGLPRPPLS